MTPRSEARRLGARRVWGNAWVDVYDDEFALPSGEVSTRVRVVPRGGVGVVVLAEHGGTVALVRTYRYPIEAWEWALPRGFGHGGAPEDSAVAELVEELGAAPADLLPLGWLTPDSGLLGSQVRAFYARYEEPATTPQDADEVAEVSWVPWADLRRRVRSGELRDGFTLGVLALADAHGVGGV